ncbi:MAG: alpha/beta hydrolase [Alphaproteobacteria bacterium]|nr:alpha/beta hydrolase [Alphaproteobacteria bacterium]
MFETIDLDGGRRLAFVHRPGKTPGVLFCGGFKSDMTGTKALALEQFFVDEGRAFTRFDYTGHGASSGDFEDGTIGAWADDVVAIIDNVTEGPLILVGSSMGGWIMVLAALARPERVKGLVGIASGPDFTEDLIWARGSEAQQAELMAKGRWVEPSAYSDQPYVITRKLIEDGRKHLVLRAPIPFVGPVHLLHGQRDPDVPWQTSLRLAGALQSEDVTVELIKSGDHRLSKPHEIARICTATQRVVALLDETQRVSASLDGAAAD